MDSMDLAFLIRRAGRHFPDALAVSDRHRTRTLAELLDRAERFANALDDLGVPPGAAVAVLSENRIEYPEIDLGLALGRRIRLALNARLHLEDFRYAMADAEAAAIVASSGFAAEATELAAHFDVPHIDLDGESGGRGYEELLAGASPQPLVRPGSAEAAAWYTYTSGTTGNPKGVELSHRAIREVAFNVMLELGPIRPGDRVVLPQPLSHGAGYFVLPYILSGGGIYVMENFDPEEILWAGEMPGIDTLKVVPAMLPPLLEVCEKDLPYDSVIYGASPMPGPVLNAALERFGPVLVQIYGQSEMPATLTCLHKQDHLLGGDVVLSAGRPWQTVALEVRGSDGEALGVDEIGEIAVCGRHAMTGYRNLPEETAKVMRDGWIMTKDIGRVDSRGYVHLLGRSDEIINSGGFNIAPREVERVLQEHPMVEECVVMGVPDERWGAAVHAVVHARDDDGLTGEQLIAGVRDRLTFRTPKKVVIVREIPKNAYGKPDRAQLRALLGVEET